MIRIQTTIFLKICFISVFAIFLLNDLRAQEKYVGQHNDCDTTLLPPSDAYRVHITNVDDVERINADFSSYPLPCEVLYQINQKRKEDETVWWQWTPRILIEIYPKK
ncbi:MAG: hypothetical protein KatS3mg027_1639 [Bacteroidia bacterium]|nr:MAG: hypothetical protein KatS3mg027_1639 [Bacteroidia bacterium]